MQITDRNSLADQLLSSVSSTGSSAGVPLRKFGRHDVQISALGFGGHHLGDAQDQPTAARIVHEAIDGGVTFFDNCWEYHNGKSENWMGRALKGRRDKIFLMSKVCTHGRDGHWRWKCWSNRSAASRPIISIFGKYTA